MKPEEIFRCIHSRMQEFEYVERIVSIGHLSEIGTEIAWRHEHGSFNDEFFREYLSTFQFQPANYLEEARSIIIISVPQPIVAFCFRWKGSDQSVIVPPTYDASIDAKLKNLLEEIVCPAGFRLATANFPLKLLAVRSGLATYGRNNICYMPGKGSFFRLVAFVSDIPCIEDSWNSPLLMERCSKCKACIIACPSGAINEHRFLLSAEKCLTFHNEHAKEFPEYVDRSWHHCLFGCLICQKVCPENKKTIKWVEERERFSEDETSLILKGVALDKIPPLTRQKLEHHLSFVEDYSLLARNLNLILK